MALWKTNMFWWFGAVQTSRCCFPTPRGSWKMETLSTKHARMHACTHTHTHTHTHAQTYARTQTHTHTRNGSLSFHNNWLNRSWGLMVEIWYLRAKQTLQKVWTIIRVILCSLQCHALHQLLVCKLHVSYYKTLSPYTYTGTWLYDYMTSVCNDMWAFLSPDWYTRLFSHYKDLYSCVCICGCTCQSCGGHVPHPVVFFRMRLALLIVFCWCMYVIPLLHPARMQMLTYMDVKTCSPALIASGRLSLRRNTASHRWLVERGSCLMFCLFWTDRIQNTIPCHAITPFQHMGGWLLPRPEQARPCDLQLEISL